MRTITDATKSLTSTAGGKNVAPKPIENRAKTNKPVTTAVLLGDKCRFPRMLVVPNLDNLRAGAVQKNLGFTDDRSLIILPEACDKIEREMRKTLRDLAHFEMPKKVLLLERDFSIENGDQTPTLKVKRRVVEKHHSTQTEAPFTEGPGGMPDATTDAGIRASEGARRAGIRGSG